MEDHIKPQFLVNCNQSWKESNFVKKYFQSENKSTKKILHRYFEKKHIMKNITFPCSKNKSTSHTH